MIMLASVTDPALNLARRVCPLVLGGLDFSPIILILALQLIGNILSVSLLLAASNQPFSLLLPVLLLQILRLVKSIAFFLIILMVARIILSLVNASRYNPIVMAIYGITEPLLAPLRRWFPDGPRGLDVKALIFLIGLIIVNNFIIDGLITIIIKKYLLFM
jgi:YggT family protein